VVRYGSIDEVVAALPSLGGQLTISVYGEPGDVDLFGPVLSVARRHAGRLIWNGVPTGVAVVESMHHGGPWPASSAALGSVGHESIRRFRRPMALQGFPIAMIDGLVRRVVS
jgi:NADP-dependent aldehyde dehydrogenase